jgi:hypothetical protein
MVVGFIPTYAISPYHHKRCEFESRSREVYSIQHYVITLVSDFRQVSGFLRVLPFLPRNITDRHDIADILLKVALNTLSSYFFISLSEFISKDTSKN